MIAIIDYKAGNLNSVAKAFEKIGAKNFIAKNPKDLQKADKLLLPGVGSFKEAMKNFSTKKTYFRHLFGNAAFFRKGL